MSALPGLRPAIAMPPALPGFEQLQRFWEPRSGLWTARLMPGEYYVTRSNEAIMTVLGSCISACVRDPDRGIGGMNHFMLPEESGGGENSWLDPKAGLATRYGSYAMESLLNQLLRTGASRSRLEVKIFGGGKILSSMTDIGERNIAFMLEYARLEGLKVSAQDVGGTQPRKIMYYPSDGKVLVRRLSSVSHNLADRERSYMHSLHGQQDGGEVELFQ